VNECCAMCVCMHRFDCRSVYLSVCLLVSLSIYCLSIHLCVCAFVCVCVCARARVCVCVRVCVHVRTREKNIERAHMHVSMHVCVRTSVCVRAFLRVSVCFYMGPISPRLFNSNLCRSISLHHTITHETTHLITPSDI